jgi:hypothetical protein
MTATFLLWLAMITVGVQTAPPLSLDIRVFNGASDVTRDTTVTIFAAGTRTDGRPVPYLPNGERQLPLPAGQYDLQLVRHVDGKVSGIAWSTLRLLVAYPGEAGRHLEVVNFAKEWGALQVRPERQSQAAATAWSSRLLRKDGSEVTRGVAGSGYQVIVAPAGAYDLVVEGPGLSPHRQAVEVKANLTYVRTF